MNERRKNPSKSRKSARRGGKQTGAGRAVQAPGETDDAQRGERLQKYLARCGVASRREAERLIEQLRVEINGSVVAEHGVRVQPGDEVRLDGERVEPERETHVVVLNKPVGTICTMNDPENRPRVYDLLPPDAGVRSVGRLDLNTEGVLLFTNDGELARRLTLPQYGVQRVYDARVRGIPSAETLASIDTGVELEDGVATVEWAVIVRQTAKNAWVRIALAEGRNREVRRLFETVGHPVMRLRRVSYAGIGLGKLKPGQWRTLTKAEVDALVERGQVGPFLLPPDPRTARRGAGKKTSSRRQR